MSDEIPVGSPPAPPGRHAAPGGWYEDPIDPYRERYWDGWQWSRQTRESERPARRSRPTSAGPGHPGPGQPGVGQPGVGQPGVGQALSGAGPAGQVDRGPGSLAGWWHRALAAILDGLLLFVVGTTALSPLYLRISERMQPVIEQMMREALSGGTVTPLRPEQLMSQQEHVIILIVTIALAMAYHVGMLRWRGQTVGKMITGLRVVPAGTGLSGTGGSGTGGSGSGGSGLSWRAALLRAMVWVVPGQHTCLWPVRVVDIVLPLTNPSRQALHDRVAGTQVVRSR